MKIKTTTGEGEHYICDNCQTTVAQIVMGDHITLVNYTAFEKYVPHHHVYQHICSNCSSENTDKLLQENGYHLVGVYEASEDVELFKRTVYTNEDDFNTSVKQISERLYKLMPLHINPYNLGDNAEISTLIHKLYKLTSKS